MPCGRSRGAACSGDENGTVILPVYDKGCRLFTPVDNQKVKMRPVLTAKEADELIKRIREIDILWVKY